MAQENLEFIEIANTEELPVNERLFIEYEGEPIVILNLAGTLYAIGDVCTHDSGPLGDGEVLGAEIICPRHGARFDLHSGKATRAPAFQDIPSYPVKIEKGKIFLGIKK
ncbi:MAG: non-heme iron oxygenase ferredoxin subunit [Leptolinea sp.]|jgi:3-phenylpropionate/trans-cinnamate dioxygenase ferredoxin subunit|nr:non-heme iron oxygenase ferredoxin subunit [Leptolinea sp.]